MRMEIWKIKLRLILEDYEIADPFINYSYW